MNPLDCFYDILNIKIRKIDDTEKMHELLVSTLKQAHGPTHDKFKLVIEVYLSFFNLKIGRIFCREKRRKRAILALQTIAQQR